MATTAPALTVRLQANSAQLKKDLREAGVEADRRAKEIEDRFNKMNPRAIGLKQAAMMGAAAGAASAAAHAVGEYVKKLGEANKLIADLDKNSTLLGMSSRRLQEIQFAGMSQGMKREDIDKGLESLGTKLNDARREENDLTKLLDSNNIKWKDREGNVLRVNEALMHVADLIKNAQTEFDRIKIAEMAGLTKEWVDALMNGGQAFDDIARRAQGAGAIIDDATIKKAKEFEDAWNAAMAAWSQRSRESVMVVLQMLEQLASAAGRIFGFIGGKLVQFKASREGLGGLSGPELEALRSSSTNPEIRNAVGAEYARRNPYGTLNPVRANGPQYQSLEELRRAMSPYQRARTGGTVIPKDKDKGGKGGGASETDQRYEEVERYIKQLEKQGRILEAERDTLGKSRVERAKAIELARIGTVTDEEQKKKLEEQIEKHVRIREEIEKIKRSKKAIEEATEFAGNQIIDVFDRIAQGGAKARDIAADLARTLLKASMQALLLGQGPLAGIFGTAAGSGGGVGGIAAMLLQATGYDGMRATGGSVPHGKWAIAGEAGPEIVKGPAMVYPAALSARAMGGGGNAFNVNVTVAGVTTPQAVQAQILAGVNQAVQIARSVVPGDFRETQRRR